MSTITSSTVELPSVTGTPLVWISPGAGINVAVMTDDQIGLAAMSKRGRQSVKTRLEQGEPLLDVLGPHAKHIHFLSVRSITAELHNTSVVIEHETPGKVVTTTRFKLPDRDEQADFVLQARDRLRNVEFHEETSSRMLYALKPFNLLVVCLLVTVGIQTFFTTDWFDVEANRERIARWTEEAERGNDAPNYIRQRSVTRSIARNPALLKFLVFGVIIIGMVAAALNAVGYKFAITLCIFATAAALYWLIARLTSPPKRLTIVSTRN